MDDHQERIEALGISRSKNDYIKQLWKLHCGDILEMDFITTDFDVSTFESTEAEPTSPQSKHLFATILETINSEPDRLNPSDAIKYKRWLEQQLTALKRLKSDVELRLRNTSSISNNVETTFR